MNKFNIFSLLIIGTLLSTSCSQSDLATPSDEVSDDVLMSIAAAGFDIHEQAPMVFEEGYLIEGDIYISNEDIQSLKEGSRLPIEEQYSTNNLVSAGGGRVITMYAATGRKGYSTAMIAGLDEAISRYNALNLSISFQRITSNSADITMTRLSKRYERQGVLGSAGFPTASGDPYDEIKMSGILESSYGLSTDGIATIIGHEMGHCIGFRHTDYFDRSISCGGSADNEGSAGIGANHIPGTSTGADLSGNGSYMLACTDGSDRPFTSQDQTALDYLY